MGKNYTVKKKNKNRKRRTKPIFFIALFNFLIIILLLTYIIYLRFIPYTTLEYNGYAVSGKDIAANLLDTNFDSDHNIKALQVKDQDSIYENLNSYYLGASKKDNINLNYPIYINNSLALYNLSPKMKLITDNFQEVQGYTGTTLTSGELYNANTLQRADYYNYILLKNSDNLYINTKDFNIKTATNEYTIKMNSIINFTSDFITYYSLENGEFIYNKILDVDNNSQVTIADYNKTSTYKDFLKNLGITKEENKTGSKDKNKNKKEENKTQSTNEVKKENKTENSTANETPEEKTVENIAGEEIKEETEEKETTTTPVEKVWIKPTVTAEQFTSNVYTAKTNITVEDPSRVIYKAITFTFYKDDQIAFRVSSQRSGEVSVTKLLPNTTYKIEGKYQYRNKEGNLIENTILEQEITTKSADTLNTIELGMSNGQVYSNKIEINDLHVASDTSDEAIYGVSKAEVLINDTKYSLDSSSLKKILKGEHITYQSAEGVKSNSNCKYEIKFYDTAGNEMRLKNNTGNTVTSKKAPSVKLKIAAQEVISVTVTPTLINEDNVGINNYIYVLYSDTGETVTSGNVTGQPIEFKDLDSQKTYTIKIYADFDISDGKGTQYNQEIGNSTFVTLPLSKLGNLKLDVSYDPNTDITYDSVNIKTAINVNKTDSRLIKILKSINLSIKDDKGKEIKNIVMKDISSLSTVGGIKNLIGNLKSNTTYSIEITATSVQGSKEEKIATTYTLKKFLTNKLPAKMSVKNVVTTTNLIDMDIYIEDTDHSCLEDIVTVRLADSYEKEYLPKIEPSNIKSSTKIPTNQWVRVTYTGLTENEKYEFSTESVSYNETNDTSKVQNNYKILTKDFVTKGLGGNVELTGLAREKQKAGSNLMDVKSENNWYSQCFDTINTEYTLDEANNVSFKTNAKYNYGKTYTESSNTINLRLLSNQCYVYDFSQYKGQTITLTFSAKTTEQNAKIYIQKGRDIGKNLEQMEGLQNTNWKEFKKTLTVPEDGYIGFYLEKYQETIPATEEGEEDKIQEKDYYLDLENVKAELGTESTGYSKYGYDLYANINVKFIDENHITYDENEQNCKYYIRLKNDKGLSEEYSYNYNSTESILEKYKYKIEESKDVTNYTIELVIKQYGREYELDKVEFKYDPADSSEIKSISNAEEFKKIQPYGSYILLNDIDLTNAGTTSEFTFGNSNISFYGNIDFNGKTIKKDTYSLTKQKDTTSYIFYKLDEKANLKNIVIDFSINNPKNRLTTKVEGIDTFIAEEDGIYSLFLYNNAKIDNVMVNLKESTHKQRINVGLLGYRNKGTIENFVVNFENTLYGSKNLAGVCLYSEGTVQNGYVYGNGIEAIDNITIGDYRNIAGVIFQVDEAGVLQNVYNISPIKMNHCDSTYSYAANIVYNVGYPPVINDMTGAVISSKDSTATVNNVYSVQPLITTYNGYEYYGIMDSTNKEGDKGPNILNKYTSTKVKESYYFCDTIYEANDYNTKSSATALYEPGVQEVMLNANGYTQFIIDTLVNNGYYPQLYLNYCMPKQDNIKIDVTGTEIIDVLSSEVVKNNDISTLEMSDKVKGEIEDYIRSNNVDLKADNLTLATFRIYNPAGTTISEINVNYMDTEIMSQSYEKKVSTVYVILKNPTSFLDEYDVSSIRSRMANGKIKESVYGPNEDLGLRKVNVTFIKNISTEEEWNKINEEDENGVSGLIQNYRLTKDLDFSDADVAPYITGTFEGNIDGQYNGTIHTIKNVNGKFSLIKALRQGTIKNLNIENFTINTDSQYAGFIEKSDIEENIEINNIHIKNMEIISTYGGGSPTYGSIAGYISSGSANEATNIKVQNCSVQGFNVDFENTNATSARVGGLIGYLYAFGGVDVYVTNDFAQNILINANVTSNSGVGGLVGYKGHDTDERRKMGSPNFYIQNCYTTGKINTMYNVGGILGYGLYGNTYVQKCWSMVNITSKMMSGDARIGGIVGYSGTGTNNVSNNLYLGNIYVAGNNVRNVNRIFGSNTGTTSYKNYAYKDQLINGETSSNQLGTTKLLTYAEIFQMNTYKNLLGFDNNYTYEIEQNGTKLNLLENEYLPELNNTEGTILANQKLTPIDTDLKLDSITSVPSADKTQVTVTMKFENRKNLNLTRVKIENDDMIVKDGTWQTSIDSNGLTVVSFIATPRRAFDSYKIESIYYERNGQEVEKEITTKIKVELYKGIASAQEWNEFFQGEGRTYGGQNVKITADIDFSTVNSIEKDVVIGKLEADSMKTISGINLKSLGASSGFIKEIKTKMSNIKFQNCSLQGEYGGYNGIIVISRGEMENCTFDNINLDFKGHYIGAISRTIAGSFKNITLNNMQIKGASYVGSLCGYATSLGASSGIKGTYIFVTATGNGVGGIFGQNDGRVSNIETYQYSEEGKKTSDKETSWLVKGNQNIGGNIGVYNGGGNYVSSLKTTNSKIVGNHTVAGNVGCGYGNGNVLTSTNNEISGVGSNVGGNVGYHSWTYTNMNSSNNTITGTTNVGGNTGNSGWATDGTITSENNKITGETNVGGNIGHQDHYYAYGYDMRSLGTKQVISGNNYVGGSVGRSTGRIKNVKTQDCTVTSRGNYTGGIIGMSEYSTPSISASNSDNYAIAGANTKNVIVNSGNNYAGGIVGYQVGTIYGNVLENSTITSKGNNVGGIAGFYTGYIGSSAASLSSSNFFLWHSYCSNSTIKGTNNVGGIAGNLILGNIQYCYVQNTDVIASNQAAGGIVGYFDNSKLNNLQYKATIKYNYIANVNDGRLVRADNSAGGIIGMAAKQLNYDEDIDTYNNVECDLVVTDVVTMGNYADIGIGSISGSEYGILQADYMNNIYAYDCSKLNGVQIGGITEQTEVYNLLTSDELKTNIYTKNDKILDEEGKTIGNKGLNFGYARYTYNNGYFPILKTSYSANLYWSPSELNISQKLVSIPTRTQEFTSAQSLDDYSEQMAVMACSIFDEVEELPEMYVYAIDVDKINIEFSNINSSAKFKIETSDTTIGEPVSITQKVYTLKYDYKTPITITLYNTDYSSKKEIKPEEVRNLLSINGDEYLYLKDNTINSNKRTLSGKYVNLYKNQALLENGNICDITTMNNTENNANIELLKEAIPIAECKVNGQTIQTFAHCSITNSNTYKDQQIFVKNGYMYAVDGQMKTKEGAVIIDSYNDNQYETVLGTDGIMYDLLTKINYPANFKNKGIIAMTNNISDKNNIALVYYKTGKVYGFNYITGEEVYDNNLKAQNISLTDYITSNFNVSKMMYNMKKADYVAAQKLTDKLEKVSIDEAGNKTNNNTIKSNETASNQENNETVNSYDNSNNNINQNINSNNKETSETTNSQSTSSVNSENISANNQIDNKYVTVYDASTQSYKIYSTAELTKSGSAKTQSENDKINNNKDLISYYTNVSSSMSKVKDVGIIVIVIIILSVCTILIIWYGKTRKDS